MLFVVGRNVCFFVFLYFELRASDSILAKNILFVAFAFCAVIFVVNVVSTNDIHDDDDDRKCE